MKILFVTDLYPIGEEKIAKALFYFVQEWQKEGHQIEVIRANFITNTLLRGRKIIEEKIYEEFGTKIYNLNFHTPFLFNVREKLPKDFSLSNYDVMISHMPCGALMSKRLLEKEKIKYICGVHASDIEVLTNPIYSIFFKNKLKKAYLLADKISARSIVLKEKIENLFQETKDKTFVAYSGIDENIIQEEIKPLNKDNLKLISVASLIKRKNIDKLIKAISLLNNKKITLTIIGNGKERKNLENLAKKLKVDKQIYFKGHLRREGVFAELKFSDIFILPSEKETFGLAYLEAMAFNNIVICSKNDGIAGIIEDGKNGFLTNSSPIEIKECIEKILNLSEEEITKIKTNTLLTIKEYTSNLATENYTKNIK